MSSFLLAGHEAFNNLLLEDDTLTPEDAEKRAEVEVEVRATIADEQQEEAEVATVTEEVEDINVAAERLMASIEHYTFAAEMIRKHGMARGMMEFINYGGSLNNTLDSFKFEGPRVPSCEALSVSGLDSSGNIDNNALLIAAGCESFVEKAWQGIKAFFEKMAKFAREMWASIKQLIMSHDKNLASMTKSLSQITNVDFGDREAAAIPAEEYDNLDKMVIAGLKTCTDALSAVEQAVQLRTDGDASFGANVGIMDEATTKELARLSALRPEKKPLKNMFDVAKLRKMIAACTKVNNDLKGLDKTLKSTETVCSTVSKSNPDKKFAKEMYKSAQQIITKVTSMQSNMFKCSNRYIKVALGVCNIAVSMAK